MAEENKIEEDINLNNDNQDSNSLTIDKEESDLLDDSIAEDYEEIIGLKEEFKKSKNKSPLSKILIGLIVFLLFLLLIGIVLYFLGFFTPKEEPVQTPLQENMTLNQNLVKEETYKFDIKDINSKKLNDQLSFLTNKNINQDKNDELEKAESDRKIIEEQKKREDAALKEQEDALLKEKAVIEEKKIQLENEKAQLESMRQEAILLKEELEANKIKLEIISNQKAKEEEVIVKETPIEVPQVNTESQKVNTFLKFINVAKIKGSLYKKYLDKITVINPNVILCRDDKNRIEIYYGPFDNDEIRSKLLDKLIKNNFEEAYEVEFTKDEFDKRCNY